MRFLKSIVFLLAFSSFAPVASAGIVLVTSEGGIAADGKTNWLALGGNSTLIPEPFDHAISGISGLNVNVSKAIGTQFQRLTQSTGWIGNFAVGEELLYSNGQGPIRLVFDAPIEGAGAQIQSNSSGVFSATIEAFDTGGTSLGMLSVDGHSDAAADDSAVFIGVLSDTGNTIGAIEINIAHPTDINDDFAINDVRIQQADAGSSPVPESANNAVWAAILLALPLLFVRPKTLSCGVSG